MSLRLILSSKVMEELREFIIDSSGNVERLRWYHRLINWVSGKELYRPRFVDWYS